MLNILMDIRFFFQPLLLKGLYLDFLNICELFCYVNMENGVLGKHKKIPDTKRAQILKRNCKHIIYIYNSPVHNSESKLCTGLFNLKIIEK